MRPRHLSALARGSIPFLNAAHSKLECNMVAALEAILSKLADCNLIWLLLPDAPVATKPSIYALPHSIR